MRSFLFALLLIASPLCAQVPGTERMPDDPRPPPEPKALAAPASGGATLKVPASVPSYELVKIDAGPGGPKDVLVMAVIQNEVRFLEVVETVGGQFVFTGPPGRYSIRVTVMAPGGGFSYATSSLTIAGTVPDPSVPPPPPSPEPPPSPQPGTETNSKPPGEGVYGFGPIVYKEAMAIRHKHAATLAKLADNFEWAEKAQIDSAAELIQKLGDRNLPLYVPEADWRAYRAAWLDQADRLTENGILPESVEDYRIVFRETAAGLRAALK